MDGLIDVLWKASLCGLVVGGAIGYFEKKKSAKAVEIANNFDQLWNGLFTMDLPPMPSATDGGS